MVKRMDVRIHGYKLGTLSLDSFLRRYFGKGKDAGASDPTRE
jgi:hypothetical protein